MSPFIPLILCPLWRRWVRIRSRCLDYPALLSLHVVPSPCPPDTKNDTKMTNNRIVRGQKNLQLYLPPLAAQWTNACTGMSVHRAVNQTWKTESQIHEITHLESVENVRRGKPPPKTKMARWLEIFCYITFNVVQSDFLTTTGAKC